MKQTAVEWLEEQIYSTRELDLQAVINQAKSMEKEQIIEAYESLEHRHGENYYNETFKSEQ